LRLRKGIAPCLARIEVTHRMRGHREAFPLANMGLASAVAWPAIAGHALASIA